MERRLSLRHVDAGKTVSNLDHEIIEKHSAQPLVQLWIPILYLLGSLLFLVSTISALPYLPASGQLSALANIIGCALFSAPIIAEFISALQSPRERTKLSANQTKAPALNMLSSQSSLAALDELPSLTSRLRPRLAAALFLIGITFFDVAAALPTFPMPMLVTTLLGSAAFLFGVVMATPRGVAAASYAAGSVLFVAGTAEGLIGGATGVGILGMWLYVVGSLFYSVGSAAMVFGAVSSREEAMARARAKAKVWCEPVTEYREQFDDQSRVRKGP
ncbi:hypothetical protein HDU86_007037 [Geranomyces michiganensis]|nr:hypothetical protein HDU86_007037 [Geranomyces michiganensis]